MKKGSIALVLLLASMLVAGVACSGNGNVEPTPTPTLQMQITRWEKSSRTIEYKSVDDYILQWTIKIDVRVSEDIDAGRARLVVSLYDDSGRYTTEQIDDLGPLSYGWGGTYDLYLWIDEGWGRNNRYGEAILYLDGKEVDKVVMHF